MYDYTLTVGIQCYSSHWEVLCILVQAWLETPSLTVKAEAELGHCQPGEVPREGVVVPVEEGGAHHLSKEWTSP